MNNNNNMRDNLNTSRCETIALIPAYNEEGTIETVIKKIMEQKIFPLVVDDGSTDRTVEMAEKTGVKVLKNKINRGKGETIRKGLKYIIENFDYYKCVVFIDADMQYKPEEAKNLIKPILDKKAKVVKGTRDLSKIPFRHRLGNKVWRFTYNRFCGGKIEDPCCGFIALSKEVVERIKLDKIYGGYIVDSSLLIEITKNGYNKRKDIKEIPVSVEYKNVSPIGRGIRMVVGVSVFHFMSGLKRKFGMEN